MAQEIVKMPKALYEKVVSTINAIGTPESKELCNLLTGCNVVVPKEKVSVPFIFSFIPKKAPEKNPLAPQLCGIYHDPEQKVAVGTDGHKLMVSPADYDESKAGKTICRDGSDLAEHRLFGRFPNWFNVIPKETEPFEFPKDFEMDYMKSLDIYKTEKKVRKYGNDHFDWVSIGREIRKVQYSGMESVNLVGMSLEHAKMILSLGLDGWRIQPSSHMLVKKLDDGTIYLFMPKICDINTDRTPTASA